MARLGDVCEILDSKRIPITASDRIPGPYPYYGANGIQDHVADYIFDDELILLAEDGGNFGSKDKPIAYRVSGKCWVNNHAHVLKPKCGYDIDYVCYSLMYYDVTNLVNGATRQKLTQADMREMVIPDRALGEQQKISAILRKLVGLISLREKQLAKLDELVKARFVEMFGDPINNTKQWEILGWDKVFNTATGKLDSNAAIVGGEYPFFTCAKEWLWIDNYAFDCEALLLAGNNAAGVYDIKYYKGKFNAYQRTYVLTLLNRSWQYALFKYQLENLLAYLQKKSKGTNTRYLTLGILQTLNFIVPPVILQCEFSYFTQQVDKQKLTIQQSLDKMEMLKKSLIQEYFG